jgi:hypothetical protein
VKFKVHSRLRIRFVTRRLEDAVPICLLISCLDEDNIFFPSLVSHGPLAYTDGREKPYKKF